MKKAILFLIVVFITSSIIANAQKPKVKFGKIEEKDLLMKVYDKDTSADALILYNEGELRFEYNNEKGFQYVYNEHIRIKIFNSNAFNYANRIISLYHAGQNEERLTSFRAVTYNMKDGEIEKSKIDNGDILWEDYSKNTRKGSYTMPNVVEGSVIDISYSIKSDYIYYLRPWQFQHNIPVVWSEYYVVIPEFYKYNVHFNGFYKLDIHEKANIQESFSYRRVGLQQQNTGVKEVHEGTINSNSLRMLMASSNIPAFKKEPYMPTSKKYLFEAEFELSSIQYPGEIQKSYAKSWNSVHTEMMEDEEFGRQLTKGFASEKVKEITSKCSGEKEIVDAIYKYVQDNYKWDNRYTVLVSQPLRKIFTEKRGSSCEINLLLTLMMREAGIRANPVLISTKDNGMINTDHPGLYQFNYTICNVRIGDSNYLLDATDNNCSPGFLPLRCVNGHGLELSDNGFEWINLEPKSISKEMIYGSFTFDEEYSLKGNLQRQMTNYFAYNFIKEVNNYQSREKYIEEFANKNHNFQIAEFKFDSIQNISQQKSNMILSITDQVEQYNDLIVFKPLIVYAETENPFKAENRVFPIYFNYPSEQNYILNYEIPEGYKVDELPESIRFSTPDKSLSLLYNISVNGKIISVNCKKSINKTFFLPNEYEIIKQFYNLAISKQNETIVLKKNL